MVEVQVVRLPHAQDLPLPRYATEGSAGMDLAAAVERDTILNPGETHAIPTGIALALPPGWEGQVRPRSGLALNYGIGMLNAPGTIDSDYRGEIIVLLTNFSGRPFRIRRGDRIAQLVVARCERVTWVESAELPTTGRSAGRFGHTGERS